MTIPTGFVMRTIVAHDDKIQATPCDADNLQEPPLLIRSSKIPFRGTQYGMAWPSLSQQIDKAGNTKANALNSCLLSHQTNRSTRLQGTNDVSEKPFLWEKQKNAQHVCRPLRTRGQVIDIHQEVVLRYSSCPSLCRACNPVTKILCPYDAELRPHFTAALKQ